MIADKEAQMNTDRKMQMITDPAIQIFTNRGIPMKTEYIYKDLTYRIIGCCFEAHKELGCIHKEIIYHKALKIELRNQEIPFTDEQ